MKTRSGNKKQQKSNYVEEDRMSEEDCTDQINQFKEGFRQLPPEFKVDYNNNICFAYINEETGEEELVPAVEILKELYELIVKQNTADPALLKKMEKTIADYSKK